MKRIKKLLFPVLLALCLCGTLIMGTNAYLEEPTLPEYHIYGVPSWDTDEMAICLDIYLDGVSSDLRVLSVHIEALAEPGQLIFHEGYKYRPGVSDIDGVSNWIPDRGLFLFSDYHISGYPLRADGKILSLLFFVDPAVSATELMSFSFDFVQVLLLGDDGMLIHPNSYTISTENIYFYRNGSAAAAPTPVPTPTLGPGSTRLPPATPPDTSSPGASHTPAPTNTVDPDATPQPGLLGDADENGIVNAADAAAILRHLVQLKTLSEQGQRNARIVSNDAFSAADAAKILRWLVQLEPETAIGLPYC